MKKRKKISIIDGKAGFTLIEVMIVLAMIAIMAAIAAPNVTSWRSNMRLKASARDLYSNLHEAKAVAVQNNETVILKFSDGEGGSYKFFVDNGEDDPNVPSDIGVRGDEIRNGEEYIVADVKLPLDITIKSSSFVSTPPGFGPTGLPYKNRIGSVILEKSNNDELREKGKEDEMRFYKISLSLAGYFKIEMSIDGENWN